MGTFQFQHSEKQPGIYDSDIGYAPSLIGAEFCNRAG